MPDNLCDSRERKRERKAMLEGNRFAASLSRLRRPNNENPLIDGSVGKLVAAFADGCLARRSARLAIPELLHAPVAAVVFSSDESATLCCNVTQIPSFHSNADFVSLLHIRARRDANVGVATVAASRKDCHAASRGKNALAPRAGAPLSWCHGPMPAFRERPHPTFEKSPIANFVSLLHILPPAGCERPHPVPARHGSALAGASVALMLPFSLRVLRSAHPMHERPIHERRTAAGSPALDERWLAPPCPAQEPSVLDAAVDAFRERPLHGDTKPSRVRPATDLRDAAMMRIIAMTGLRSCEVADLRPDACPQAADALKSAGPVRIRVFATYGKREPERSNRREGTPQ